MPESTDTIVVETPKPTLRSRFITKKNAKRVAITGVAAMAALWVKSKLNTTGSVSADLHVETDESNDN